MMATILYEKEYRKSQSTSNSDHREYLFLFYNYFHYSPLDKCVLLVLMIYNMKVSLLNENKINLLIAT